MLSFELNTGFLNATGFNVSLFLHDPSFGTKLDPCKTIPKFSNVVSLYLISDNQLEPVFNSSDYLVQL